MKWPEDFVSRKRNQALERKQEGQGEDGLDWGDQLPWKCLMKEVESVREGARTLDFEFPFV